MANQDSGFVGIEGTLLVSVSSQTIVTAQLSGVVGILSSIVDAQNLLSSGHIIIDGVLNSSIDGKQNGPFAVVMRAEADMLVSPRVYSNAGVVSFVGELITEDLSAQNLVNAYSSMFGFLSSNIVNAHALVYCADLTINMIVQEIDSSVCRIKGASVELKRFRGDTYPVQTVLGRNGNTNIEGHTFKLSSRLNNKILYTSVGTIIDGVNGRVEFVLEVDAVGEAGSGVYDIEGNDGTYVYTYEKGVFTIVDDLTV